MGTEVWFRNINAYISEVVDERVMNYVFSSEYLQSKRIDLVKMLNLHVPIDFDYRCLAIDFGGTVELRRGHTFANPAAVYPTWDYQTSDMRALEYLCNNPVGDDEKKCADERIPIEQRPVFGQEHRIMIYGVPPAMTGVGKRFYSILRDIQIDYPDTIIHTHGLTSYRMMFGFGFRSCDVWPKPPSKGGITLPNGKPVQVQHARNYMQWLSVLGFKPTDLVGRALTAYNIRSALWAGEYWTENFAFMSTSKDSVDSRSKKPAPVTATTTQKGPTLLGDKVLCNQCSLARSCKFYREGEVCSLPGSNTATLAKMFGSRDPDQIMDGLGALIEMNLERIAEGRDTEKEVGGDKTALDTSVTAVVRDTFGFGKDLAKLLDPKRFSPAKTLVLPPGSSEEVPQSPRELVAGIVKELSETHGIDVKDVTPGMIAAVLASRPEATDAVVIDVPAIEAPSDV